MLFLCLPPDLHSQTEGKEHAADSVRNSIEVEKENWSESKPIIIVVRLENISDKDISFLGIYSFELKGAPGLYWSPVNILSGKPLELENESEGLKRGGGRVPKGAIHLDRHETKTMKFDLSTLLWNKSFSSVWPNQKLFEVAPRGNYDLIFSIETGWQAKSDNTDDVTHIPSNSVRIVIE